MSNAENENYSKLVAQNRKAHYEYEILEKFEAGIMLTGSEVKSLRNGKASIAEAFADIDGKNILLRNMTISRYNEASGQNHEEKRPRKLLLHKSEINKLIGKIQVKGLTLVPLTVYFNKKNLVKLELALVKGKKLHDKRETEKKRDWNKQKARVLKTANKN